MERRGAKRAASRGLEAPGRPLPSDDEIALCGEVERALAAGSPPREETVEALRAIARLRGVRGADALPPARLCTALRPEDPAAASAARAGRACAGLADRRVPLRELIEVGERNGLRWRRDWTEPDELCSGLAGRLVPRRREFVDALCSEPGGERLLRELGAERGRDPGEDLSSLCEALAAEGTFPWTELPPELAERVTLPLGLASLASAAAASRALSAAASRPLLAAKAARLRGRECGDALRCYALFDHLVLNDDEPAGGRGPRLIDLCRTGLVGRYGLIDPDAPIPTAVVHHSTLHLLPKRLRCEELLGGHSCQTLARYPVVRAVVSGSPAAVRALLGPCRARPFPSGDALVLLALLQPWSAVVDRRAPSEGRTTSASRTPAEMRRRGSVLDAVLENLPPRVPGRHAPLQANPLTAFRVSVAPNMEDASEAAVAEVLAKLARAGFSPDEPRSVRVQWPPPTSPDRPSAPRLVVRPSEREGAAQAASSDSGVRPRRREIAALFSRLYTKLFPVVRAQSVASDGRRRIVPPIGSTHIT